MKLSDLPRVNRLREERTMIEDKIRLMQRFVIDQVEAKAIADRARKKAGNEPEAESEGKTLEYSLPNLVVSARYRSQSSMTEALRVPFDMRWCNAIVAVLREDVQKIDEELTSLGVTV